MRQHLDVEAFQAKDYVHRFFGMRIMQRFERFVLNGGVFKKVEQKAKAKAKQKT